jgi:hypothetical protein
METLKEDFLRVYANVPLGLRGDIIVIFKDRPLTWDVVYVEVKANTDLSAGILKELKGLDLI